MAKVIGHGLELELELELTHFHGRLMVQTSWSPQQISRRLTLDFPDDAPMRVSHEAIYQALYI